MCVVRTSGQIASREHLPVPNDDNFTMLAIDRIRAQLPDLTYDAPQRRGRGGVVV